MGLDNEGRWLEVSRMMNVVRYPDSRSDLLAQLLDGTEASVEVVTRLLGFARKHFDPKADVLPKIEEICIEYLRRNNAPVPEVKHVGCALDEFGE